LEDFLKGFEYDLIKDVIFYENYCAIKLFLTHYSCYFIRPWLEIRNKQL